MRPGDDVVLGHVRLPWSDEALRPFVRAVAGRTMQLSDGQLSNMPHVSGDAAIGRGARSAKRGSLGSIVWFLILLVTASLVVLFVMTGADPGFGDASKKNKGPRV